MTQQIIITTPRNSGDGTPIATAFDYCNNNFSQLFSRAQVSPPPTSVGSIGDQAGMYAYDSTYFYYCFSNYTGNTTIWNQIEQAGNISATQILNGTSSIAIASANANATVSINSTPNVVVFTSTGANITGYVISSGNIQGGNIRTVGQLSATGNVTGNYFIGNGSQLTGLPATYSNSNVTTLLSAFGSNSISTTGTITSGNITGGNILTNGTASAQGNITTQGAISATGDIITAGSFIGNFAGNITGNLVVNGSNTQVLFNTNGNCDAVGGMTYNKDSNTFIILGTISSQGNTIGGNILTGGVASAGGNITGANLLTGGLVSATSTITSGGNITGANLLTGGLMSSTGNATHGNILTGGLVSATGNVSGNYLRSTNDVIVGGNVSTTNLTGTGVSVTANIIGGNLLTGGLISATGNVTGNYFIGNGSQLTDIPSPYGNANVTSLLSAFGSNTISTTGTITSGNVTGGNILTGGLISASGAISGASASVSGGVTAASVAGGTITGSSTSVTGSQTAASTVGGIITGSSTSVTGNVTGSGLVGNVYTNSIINTGSNSTGNIGSSSTYFNTVFATATTALYADLAEKYTADAEYAPGTIVSFGGIAEITISLTDADPLIAGVVSTNPAYLMNSGLTDTHTVAVALTGRVPCRVQGPVTRGAMMVSAGNGRARAESAPAMGTVIGKAVEAFTGDIGTIEIVVGRL